MKNSNNGTTMSRGNARNTIKLIGEIAGNAEFSHEVIRKSEADNRTITYYRFTIKVPRLSGVSDFLEVIVSEEMWLGVTNCLGYIYGENSPQATQGMVEVFGRIQSRNCIDPKTDKNKLDLFVFAQSVRVLTTTISGDDAENNISAALYKNESLNTVSIEGFVCKKPVIRQTPLGRTIADLFIAVNRHGGSAYIPVILWGGNAANAKNLNIGDKLRFDGRFQSREYMKAVDGQAVTFTAYEMSASKVTLLDKSLFAHC